MSEGTGSNLHEAIEFEKEESGQAAGRNSENLCELAKKCKDQNDDLVDQIKSSAPNCGMDSKAIAYGDATSSNDASGQTKPSNGEQAFESNPPDASLGKETCMSTERLETNLNLSVNDTSDTSSKDVEMSPACKALLPSNSEENAPACSELQESHSGVGSVVETKPPVPSPEAVENVTNESEVTPMETDDTEGQNSGAGAFVPENGDKVEPESNQTQTSFSERYCDFGNIAVYFLNWKMVLKLNIDILYIATKAPILKVWLLLIIIFVYWPILKFYTIFF